MAVNLVVSTVSMALGVLIVVAPARAAEIWGSERLEKVGPGRRASVLRWYRVFGFLLCLGGTLVAIDTIVFSNYSR